MPERSAPTECANCGATIPRGAKACPECGADERTGWRDTDVYDGLDLPDDGRRNEAGHRSRNRSDRDVNGLAWYWWCIGVAVIGALALAVLRGL
jgi:hypothetical protein